MVKIYYSSFENRLSNAAFSRYLSSLPAYQQNRIKRFRRWQDAHACLFGKLLLLKGLAEFGYDVPLQKLKYTEFDRPYFENCIDFNISHSGTFVACAFFLNGRIGLDIEEIKPVPVEDFKGLWTEEDWAGITGSKDVYRTFFKNWTMKEAIIKADGKGLNIALKDIIIRDNSVALDSGTWYLKEINLSDAYAVHIATDRVTEGETLENIKF